METTEAMSRYWTTQEDGFIKDNFQTMNCTDISISINRTKSAVKNRVHILGLYIDRTNLTPERLGQYPKGNVPLNKGVKMSPELYEKAKRTMFKKGNKPHNTRIKGEFSDRLDNTGKLYRYIKIKDSHWQLYHRYVWEQINGKVPKGHVVAFFDGNTLNCVIENLKLITRADNAIRNSIYQYPKEVQELIKLKNKLKKQCDAHQP